MTTVLKAIDDSPSDKDRFEFDIEIARSIVDYGRLLARRGLICNSLGNIAVRAPHNSLSSDPVYTKHLGISLEEMTIDQVVVTDIEEGALLYGTIPPSIGHQLNRAIFKSRSDVQAIIHTHPNVCISYFCAGAPQKLPMISADAALVIGAPPLVMDRSINLELDTSLIPEVSKTTNVLIMPNHGVTTYGRSISEAYHRMTTTVAELDRLFDAEVLAKARGTEVCLLSPDESRELFEAAGKVIYDD